MKIRYLSFLLFLFTLFSCTLASNSNMTSNYSENASYEKDEDNFYKLDSSLLYEPLSEEETSQIFYAEQIEDFPLSSSLRLYAEGNEIPLYNVKVNSSHTWTASNYSRVDNSVGIIRKKGSITLVLATNFSLKYGVSISPKNKNVEYTYDETTRIVKFTIVSSGQYTIEFRLNRTLHLFVDDEGLYDEYRNDDSVIYFAPGIHNHSNDSRIDSNNNLTIYSNQTVFLDYGAVLQGSIVSSNTSNVKIVGGGIIDGSTFERDANAGTRQIPLDFNFVSDSLIEGITFLDPAGWTLNIYFNQKVEIYNIKIISSRSNGDGISLQSCQDISVNNCFVRSWDDSLVVKNYIRWDNTSTQGETKNIYFNNCLIWTDLAQSMEIGYETVGKVMDNIHFDNIIVIHNYHKPVMSIHNGNNADITNVYYNNIIVEDASLGKGDGNKYLIELTTTFSSTWSTSQATTELGSIKGVYFENIVVLDGISDLQVRLIGCVDNRSGYESTLHEISDVQFKNVVIYDELFFESSDRLIKNDYVKDLTFEA